MGRTGLWEGLEDWAVERTGLWGGLEDWAVRRTRGPGMRRTGGLDCGEDWAVGMTGGMGCGKDCGFAGLLPRIYNSFSVHTEKFLLYRNRNLYLEIIRIPISGRDSAE